MGTASQAGLQAPLICQLPAPTPGHGLITQSLAAVLSARELFPCAFSPLGLYHTRSLAQRDSSSRPTQMLMTSSD